MKVYTFLKIFISCSNIPHLMLYPYVSSKCFILKMVKGGFSVSRCPSLPYRYSMFLLIGYSEPTIEKMQDKLILQMAPDEASWAIFMGQVEHGPACP